MQLEEALQKKDSGFLDSLRTSLTAKRKLLETQIGESIDARKDYPGATALVRTLMFLQKIDDEIDTAYAAIE